MKATLTTILLIAYTVAFAGSFFTYPPLFAIIAWAVVLADGLVLWRVSWRNQ